jgi:signal transduction histidine kinase
MTNKTKLVNARANCSGKNFRNATHATETLAPRLSIREILETSCLFVAIADHELNGMCNDTQIDIDRLTARHPGLENGKKYLNAMNRYFKRIVYSNWFLLGTALSKGNYMESTNYFSAKEMKAMGIVSRNADIFHEVWKAKNTDYLHNLFLNDLSHYISIIKKVRPLVSEVFELMKQEEDAELANEYARRVSDVELAAMLANALYNLHNNGRYELSHTIPILVCVDKEGVMPQTRNVDGMIIKANFGLNVGLLFTKIENGIPRGTEAMANKLSVALIFRNILTNARRSALEKGVEPRVQPTIDMGDGRIRFSLADNGNGMDAETMRKLNEGIEVTTKTESGRHGFGFAYCRKLAQQMGGDLYVKESVVGIGTTVTLELKIAD